MLDSGRKSDLYVKPYFKVFLNFCARNILSSVGGSTHMGQYWLIFVLEIYAVQSKQQ